MIVIFGALFVLGAVIIGFSMAGGHVGALIHLSEFVTIGGAAFGALIITSPKKVLKDVMRGVMQSLKGNPFNKEMCREMLKFLYATARLIKREGTISLESHISSPEESTLFQAFPMISKNEHIRDFVCDTLSLIVDGKVKIEEITSAIEDEIKVVEREHHAASSTMQRTADSLPGFGIVAAVLGIVVTMQSIGGPVDEIGHKVGAALVGTFLGILLAYGFVAPLAGRMEALGESEITFLRAAGTAVIAIASEAGPKDVVIRARRVLGTEMRPSQGDMAKLFKEVESA